MKFHNREDELQELNLLRNAMPSMIVLIGRRRVGKTELIKKFLEGETGVYFFVDSEKSEKMLIAEFSAPALNSETDEILFAECKWSSAPLGPGVVEDLFEKSKLVDWRMENRREYFAVFSKSGFGKSGLEYCREHGVLPFDADQIAGCRSE